MKTYLKGFVLIYVVMTIISLTFQVWEGGSVLETAFLLNKVLGNLPIALVIAAGSFYFGKAIGVEGQKPI